MKTVFFAFLVAMGSVSAQSVHPSEIRHVDGNVFLNDQRVQPSGEFPKITENALIRTGDGRAEVLLAPGITLRIGEHGSFRMTANRPRDIRIEVLAGPAVVITDGMNRDAKLTVFCEAETALSSQGEYRFDNRHHRDINENFCMLKVYRGAADVRLSTVKASLRPGRMMDLNRQCGDHIPINRFDAGEPQGNHGFQ